MFNGEKIQVDLLKCEIREHSVLIYERQNPRSGVVEKFVTRVIPKDKITLSFYLDKQKHTSLYVDRENRGRYYFDLDFLGE